MANYSCAGLFNSCRDCRCVRYGAFSLAGFKTRERVVQSVKEPSLIDNFKVLVKNKPLLLIIIGNVLSSFGGISGVFQTYYYSEVLDLNSAVCG